MTSSLYAAPQIQFNVDMFSAPSRHHAASPDEFLERPPSPRTDTSMSDLSAALKVHSLSAASLAAPVAQRPRIVDDIPLLNNRTCWSATCSASIADSTYSSTRSNSSSSMSSSTSSASAPACLSLRRTCSSTDVRRQRQRALWNQCSTEHLQQISKLVARMVAQGDQCNVCESHQAAAVDHDSGIEDDDGDDESVEWDCDIGRARPSFLPRHRTALNASYPSPCRVSKQPQMRKHGKKRPATR